MKEVDKLKDTRALIQLRKRALEEVCTTNKEELDDLRDILARLVVCREQGEAMLCAADLEINEVLGAAREANLAPGTRAQVEKHVQDALANQKCIASMCEKVRQDIGEVQSRIKEAELTLDKALGGVAAMAEMLRKIEVVTQLCGIDT